MQSGARISLSLLAVSLITLAHAGALQSDGETGFGNVEGRVVDSESHPVKHARVTAQLIEGSSIGKVNSAYSDESGEFLLTRVVAGLNIISASKEQDGYPNTLFAAFAASVDDRRNLPRVVVVANTTIRGVVVWIGSKGGRLKGVVLDNANGEALNTARVKLVREDDPRLYYDTSVSEHGSFDLVLPVKPFRMEVSAPGYSTWTSRGLSDSDAEGGFLIPSEGTKTVIVELNKKAKNN